ncbi:MAG TPA: ACP phosphodiesterase [Motiliproteus sp.]
MNYLAHLYFADPTPESRVGHLMGDFYSGPIGPELPPAVAEGVVLHRRVDAYTDAHPQVQLARARMQGPLRRYAGIILDIAFDHFLCRHWQQFHAEPLEAFLAQLYTDLELYRGVVPSRMQPVLQRLWQQRWLAHYRELAGVNRALERTAARLSRPSPLVQGGLELERHYAALESDFLVFFPQLITFFQQQRSQLRQRNDTR